MLKNKVLLLAVLVCLMANSFWGAELWSKTAYEFVEGFIKAKNADSKGLFAGTDINVDTVAQEFDKLDFAEQQKLLQLIANPRSTVSYRFGDRVLQGFFSDIEGFHPSPEVHLVTTQLGGGDLQRRRTTFVEDHPAIAVGILKAINSEAAEQYVDDVGSLKIAPRINPFYKKDIRKLISNSKPQWLEMRKNQILDAEDVARKTIEVEEAALRESMRESILNEVKKLTEAQRIQRGAPARPLTPPSAAQLRAGTGLLPVVPLPKFVQPVAPSGDPWERIPEARTPRFPSSVSESSFGVSPDDVSVGLKSPRGFGLIPPSSHRAANPPSGTGSASLSGSGSASPRAGSSTGSRRN